MPDYLNSTSYAYENVSSGFVETLIQSRREELFTGLMRLAYPTGEIFIQTFLEGVQQNLYRCWEKSTEIIGRRSWSDAIDLPNASVSFMPLSVEAMRLMFVVLEAPIVRVEEETLTAQRLSEQTVVWSQNAEPSVLHIRADHIDRLYLMSGISSPLIESVSLENGASNFSITDVSFPSLLPAANYQVIRYVSDPAHAAWQEHEVRMAFNPWMRLILNRFSELAGRMLTERLCEQLSARLKEQGWNIRVSMNGVSNRQYFETLAKAVQVYLDIILTFHQEAAPAIGQQMAEGLTHEVLAKLDSYRREIILHMIYDQNRIDAVTGRVWR